MNNPTTNLTAEQAAGMTVNERLYCAGLIPDFDLAVDRKDKMTLYGILKQVYLDDESIKGNIESLLGKNFHGATTET